LGQLNPNGFAGQAEGNEDGATVGETSHCFAAIGEFFEGDFVLRGGHAWIIRQQKRGKTGKPVFPLSSFRFLVFLFQNERKHHQDRNKDPGKDADAGEVFLDHAVIGIELVFLRLVRNRNSWGGALVFLSHYYFS
jgi:hypothetical protein